MIVKNSGSRKALSTSFPSQQGARLAFKAAIEPFLCRSRAMSWNTLCFENKGEGRTHGLLSITFCERRLERLHAKLELQFFLEEQSDSMIAKNC